jgi:hypothetical protein
MDTDESRRGLSVVKRLQDLWRTSNIGPSWLDLRGMNYLKTLILEGVSAVWVPDTLEYLEVDSQGCAPSSSGLHQEFCKIPRLTRAWKLAAQPKVSSQPKS